MRQPQSIQSRKYNQASQELNLIKVLLSNSLSVSSLWGHGLYSVFDSGDEVFALTYAVGGERQVTFSDSQSLLFIHKRRPTKQLCPNGDQSLQSMICLQRALLKG